MHPYAVLILISAKLTSTDSRTPKQRAALERWSNHAKIGFTRARKPKLECQYCCEKKPTKDFISGSYIPWNCQPHLTGQHRVCKHCIQSALGAQIDCKALLDIGCPQCGAAWEPDDVKMLLGSKDGKRFREIDRQAQERVFVPDELPDELTLEDMLKRGARCCPACRWPFVKVAGCENVQCRFAHSSRRTTCVG